MIKIEVINGKSFANLADLKEYEKNPRVISREDYQRLRNLIIELGMFKPNLCMEDGTVLGGNQRLKIYRELKKEKVWVSIVKFIEKEGKIFGVIDGVEMKRAFKSIEEAKFIYAMADNDRAGTSKKELIQSLIKELDIDVEKENIKIDLGKAVKLGDIATLRAEEKPEIQFSPELLHENNYVIFAFDNILDWQVIEKSFGIKTVKSLSSKKDYFQAGTGRVINGLELLKVLNNQK